MHIIFIEKGYPRSSGVVGGAGTYIQLHARRLIRLGHEVSVLCGKMADNTVHFKDDRINVYPIISAGPYHYYLSKIPGLKVLAPLVKYLETGWKTHRFLIKLNNKNKIDIIEYTEGGDFWNAIFNNFEYIAHLHGSAYTFKKNSGQVVKYSDWLQRKAEHYFIKRANAVVSPCHAMIQLVEQEMEQTIKNAQVIPYPIDEMQLKKTFRENFLLPKNKIIIFFASRNDPVKGGELLIEALKQLPTDLKGKIEVRFYGYRPKQDTSGISFLSQHDFVPKQVLLEAYNEADICVIPSYFDNSPNTVYEAMGAGKVIVASSVGGIPEIIGSPECGFLFKPGNPDDLRVKLEAAIQLVIENKHIFMGKAAQNRITALSDIEANTEKRLQLIKP